MKEYYELAARLLEKFVSYPTVNGDERPLAEWIGTFLHDKGFNTKLQHVSDNRSNVIAHYGASANKLIFTGHLDVVPTGEGWRQNDPFCLTKQDGRLYGRGACDMKAGIAAMIAACLKAKSENLLKDHTVELAFVADEEVNGSGSIHYLSNSHPEKDSMIIIGEPTMLNACIAHRGVTRFKVEIFGRQCHSGNPSNGINAIYCASKFLLEIEKLDNKYQSEKSGILPAPNITATVMNSGVKENAVPGVAEIILDCRTVPSQTPCGIFNDIEDILKKLFGDTEVTYKISNFINVLPSEIKKDSKICKLLDTSYRSIYNKPILITHFDGCCDMSYFYNAGCKQVLLCGPGSMGQAHIVDEYVTEEQLFKAVDLYYEMIKVYSRNCRKYI